VVLPILADRFLVRFCQSFSISMKSPKTDWLDSVPVTATNKKAETALFPFLWRLIRGDDLTLSEASELFRIMIDENANPAQMAGVLTALTAKGETSTELAGMAGIMRKNSVQIKSKRTNAVDIVGTGSSSARTFNVSTAAALVAAGAGLTIAKQCNRGVSGPAGSSDVLKELGVKIANESGPAEASLNGTGLCFFFAPKFHPSIRRLGELRRSLGNRTCLNVLGLIANPAPVRRHLIGVWHPTLVEPVANALSLLGTENAWVVHGADGMDEISISGQTYAIEVKGNVTRKFHVEAKDFGLKPGKTGHLTASTAKQSAAIIRDVLASRRRDEARSLVVINAAAALIIGGIAKDPLHAARLAEQSIDSGQAQNKLERLIQTTNKK
jgi:anthranilate phosphoribosyltransferase